MNALYRKNLSKGQTGLSVAFDLPTQTGYDADHPLARGEVGKVGVPVGAPRRHAALLDGIPLDAHEHVDDDQRAGRVAAGALRRDWPSEQGAPRTSLQGTTQNDIVKEYSVARHLHLPARAEPSKLTADTIAWCTHARCRSGTR